MAEISLEDLLAKSVQDLKKQVLNPFPSPAKVEPSVAALQKNLARLKQNLVQTPVSEDRPTQSPAPPSEDLGMLSLAYEIAERKSRHRGAPDGLELIEKGGEQHQSQEPGDDPNLGGRPARHPMFQGSAPSAPTLDEIGGEEFDGSVSIPHGIDGERDTPEDVFRDQNSLKPKKHKKVDNALLHGGGERDTIEDVITDKHRYIPNQEDDDEDYLELSEEKVEEEDMSGEHVSTAPPAEIGDKLYATKSRNTFTGIGILGRHVRGSVVEGNDGYEYKILSISQSNNGVHLRRLDTGYSCRTSYTKFFGVEPPPFPFEKGDRVSYYDSKTMDAKVYVVVGLNPASNNVQLMIDGKKRFIRATKVKMIQKQVVVED